MLYVLFAVLSPKSHYMYSFNYWDIKY